MIDKSSYMRVAMSVYDNPGCVDEKEFEYDARRPIRIKFILRKWEEEGRNIEVMRLLNHIIVMRNCFGRNAVNMICMFCDDYLPQLLPFTDYLNITPAILSFDGKNIVSDHIVRDPSIKKIIESS